MSLCKRETSKNRKISGLTGRPGDMSKIRESPGHNGRVGRSAGGFFFQLGVKKLPLFPGTRPTLILAWWEKSFFLLYFLFSCYFSTVSRLYALDMNTIQRFLGIKSILCTLVQHVGVRDPSDPNFGLGGAKVFFLKLGFFHSKSQSKQYINRCNGFTNRRQT